MFPDAMMERTSHVVLEDLALGLPLLTVVHQDTMLGPGSLLEEATSLVPLFLDECLVCRETNTFSNHQTERAFRWFKTGQRNGVQDSFPKSVTVSIMSLANLVLLQA